MLWHCFAFCISGQENFDLNTHMWLLEQGLEHVRLCNVFDVPTSCHVMYSLWFYYWTPEEGMGAGAGWVTSNHQCYKVVWSGRGSNLLIPAFGVDTQPPSHRDVCENCRFLFTEIWCNLTKTSNARYFLIIYESVYDRAVLYVHLCVTLFSHVTQEYSAFNIQAKTRRAICWRRLELLCLNV